MSKFKTLRFIFFLFWTVKRVQCHDLLIDFLNIQRDHPLIEFHLTESCASSLSLIKNGIEQNEVWAMKVQDASGKSQPGFVWGNNFWLGLEKQCNLLNKPRKVPMILSTTRRMQQHVTSIATKIPVEYRMFYASHTSTVQFDTDLFDFVGFHIGLCFPKSCQEDEIERMAQVVFQSYKFQNTELYGNVTFTSTKTLDLRPNFFQEPAVKFLMWVFEITKKFHKNFTTILT